MPRKNTTPTPRPRAKGQRLDVRAHFGLHAIPMTREIAVRDRWHHPIYEEALADLQSIVIKRMSGAIIAPAGAGKTGVLRALTDSLPEARYRVHYLKVTDLNKRDFCREIAVALGCSPAGYYGALVNAIQQRCQTLLDQESLRPVIVIDEAHDIRPDVLAILRVLTNFDMDSRLVVSIVLAGQNKLRQLLRRDDLEAVSKRIAEYVALRLLSRQEARQYVAHRLEIAGAKTDLFDDAAYDALYEAAQGNLRATSRLALKSLEVAAAEGAHIVGADQVATARQKVWP